MQGGLKLDSTTWLLGAEPTFRLTPVDPGPVDVYLDGNLLLQSRDGSAIVALADRGMSVGDHVIVFGGRTRRFTIAQGDSYIPAQVPGPEAALGHDLAYDGTVFRATYPSPRPQCPDLRPRPGIRIEGGQIRADPSVRLGPPISTIGIPVGWDRYIVLGVHVGAACIAPEGGKEFTPPFPPVWLVHIGLRRLRWEVVLVGPPAPPSRQVLPEGNMRLWSAVMGDGRCQLRGPGEAFWKQYLELASEIVTT